MTTTDIDEKNEDLHCSTCCLNKKKIIFFGDEY